MCVLQYLYYVGAPNYDQNTEGLHLPLARLPWYPASRNPKKNSRSAFIVLPFYRGEVIEKTGETLASIAGGERNRQQEVLPHYHHRLRGEM